MPWPSSAARNINGVILQPRSLWSEIRRNRNAYLFIAPFFIIFAVFMLFPILFSFVLSFHEWNGIMAVQPIGFRHYQKAFHDENLLNAFANTLLFTLITVITGSTLGLGLALFLNTVRFLKRLYRGIFFIPAIVSLVVVSLVWKLMLNSEVGFVNDLIHRIGFAVGRLTGSTPDWARQKFRLLDNQNGYVQLLTVAMVNVWAVVGFNTVIFLAGLQGIPAHLYEVSRLDGATRFQNFRYITFPLLRPTTFFVVLITSIDALQVFVLPNVMNRNSSGTMTIVYYLYRNAFEFYRMGYASAIAYLLFAVTVGLSLLIRYTIGHGSRWSGQE